MGLLRDSDVVVFNAYELLYVAKQVANALAESGYRPPLPARAIPVAGDVGTATFKASLANLQAGYFASEHDVEIATRIADTLCGGVIERGSTVDEEWLLALERKHFVELAQDRKDAGPHRPHHDHRQTAQELMRRHPSASWVQRLRTTQGTGFRLSPE